MTAGSQTPDARLEKRRKQALGEARSVAIFGGFILASAALVELVYVLQHGLDVCNQLSIFSLKLVEVLSCKPDLGQGWGLGAIYVGIVVEFLLILFFLARVFSGKGFISAVLLFILFGVETGFEIAGGVGSDEWHFYLIWGGLAFGLGIGVWVTWQYRRLSRKIAAASPSDAA